MTSKSFQHADQGLYIWLFRLYDLQLGTTTLFDKRDPVSDTIMPSAVRLAAARVKFSPSFEEMRLESPVLLPLMLVTLISVAGVLSLRPALTSVQSARGLPTSMEMAFLIAGLGAPVVALIRTGILGCVTWAVCSLNGRKVRLLPIVSLMLYAETVLASTGLWIGWVLYLRGYENVRELADFQAPMGLDILWQAESAVVQGVLSSMSMFHLIWFMLLVAGLPTVARVSRGLAIAAASSAWGAIVLYAVVRALVA